MATTRMAMLSQRAIKACEALASRGLWYTAHQVSTRWIQWAASRSNDVRLFVPEGEEVMKSWVDGYGLPGQE